jgi:hypothetical protein
LYGTSEITAHQGPPQISLASPHILLYCPACVGCGPRKLFVVTALDDIPARPLIP